MPRKIIYVFVYIILNIPITYRICQSDCAPLHQKLTWLFSYLDMMQIPTQRVIFEIYRVVHQTKRENMVVNLSPGYLFVYVVQSNLRQ